MHTATLRQNVMTPLNLAQEPIRVDIGDSRYSAQMQMRTFACGHEPLTVTFSGTQTFGGNGRPMDSDND